MTPHYITKQIETPAGIVEQVSTVWTKKDLFSTIKVRWAIGRMNYIVIIILVFSLNLKTLFSQNQVEKYYKYVNQAELAICNEKYEDAGIFYKKAFAEHTPFCIDLWRAYTLNYEYLNNINEAIKYAHILIQRDSTNIIEEYVMDTIKEAIMYAHLKALIDTIKMTIIPELQTALNAILEDDQNIRIQYYNDADKIRAVDSVNSIKLKLLYQKYGSINETNAGSFYQNQSGLRLNLLHNGYWLNDPKDIVFQDVMNGNFDAREYAFLQDRFKTENLDPSENKPYKAYYARNVAHAMVIDNVLFLMEPDNVEEVNENRKSIYISETWEDYKTKLLHAFYNKSPNFKFAMLQRFNFGEDEDNIRTINEIKAEIDEEHKIGNYKRSYYEK